jgi:hypothetical protein
MTEGFKQWSEAWPDWPDAGRRVEIITDGKRTIGELCADEIWTGEDAIPGFSILRDDGLCAAMTAEPMNFQMRLAVRRLRPLGG